MSRTTLLVLIALGATLAGFALSTNARRLQDDDGAVTVRPAAGPQRAQLGWRETHGSRDESLVFSVDSLEVRRGGWEAAVGIVNESSVPWELVDPIEASGLSFGLMLLPSGEQSELDRRDEERTLPAVRKAVRFEPALPALLQPGESWDGTISAPGALVADSWVRVVFGPLVSVGSPPDGLEDVVVWITDRTTRLRP
jgi:hypothetical protein